MALRPSSTREAARQLTVPEARAVSYMRRPLPSQMMSPSSRSSAVVRLASRPMPSMSSRATNGASGSCSELMTSRACACMSALNQSRSSRSTYGSANNATTPAAISSGSTERSRIERNMAAAVGLGGPVGQEP